MGHSTLSLGHGSYLSGRVLRDIDHSTLSLGHGSYLSGRVLRDIGHSTLSLGTIKTTGRVFGVASGILCVWAVASGLTNNLHWW
jgi:hypothetical protein